MTPLGDGVIVGALDEGSVVRGRTGEHSWVSSMATKEKRIVKVMRLRILKPAGEMSWSQLGKLLRDTRYRVFRLANLAVSEAYLNFHLWRTGRSQEFKADDMGKLSRRLRQMLADEGVAADELDRFSPTGAVPDAVSGPLFQYKIRAITNKNKWREVIRGTASLPTFRLDMAIPVRCDKARMRRLERMENGDVQVELTICRKPYPRVVLQTGDIGGGQEAILARLLDNTGNDLTGYRQRVFEIKQERQTSKWWLYITYDLPAPQTGKADPDVVVGVDVGYAVPLYVAINNGHARLGWRQFDALGRRIRKLQTQVLARRRSIQRGGRVNISHATARSGHGVKRKLLPTEILQRRIDKAYQTLNHQLSASVIDFARDHGAGVIQVEDLEGLKEELTGTYIGARWRYHQLHQFLKYKAEENGIEFRAVNPRFTSRRCSKCGHINVAFDRAYRDAHRENGKTARFICPQCGFEADADYNAARNLATLDIEALIEAQCARQGLTKDAL